MSLKTLGLSVLISIAISSPAQAQGRPDPAKMMAAQREAMQKLTFLDGVWRGPASTVLANGEKHVVTQTERVGPLLEGGLKVIEGRAYDADGKTSFNALGVVSFNQNTASYSMRSYAQGFVGDYALSLTADGFTWEIPAGPMTMRYTAVIKDGHWKEVGDRLFPGKEPQRFFEMELQRLGDTGWPAAAAVGLK